MGVKAYFLTWTTYGTWLPGNLRGWVDRHRTHGEVVEPPDPKREAAARQAMMGEPAVLDQKLREIASSAMVETAAYCGWTVHAMDVRSNHVHVVVTAADRPPGDVMRMLKVYASRAMNRIAPGHNGRWWTRQGSKRNLFTDDAVAAAVRYVRNQDTAWMKE